MTPRVAPSQPTCFFEHDPGAPLRRRATVEAIGTCLLVLAVLGSGQMAGRLAPTMPGLGLLLGAIAAGTALASLITALGTVSGAHFNPLITILQWLSDERSLRCTIFYVAAQIGGAACGAMTASALFGFASFAELPHASWAPELRDALGTMALLLIVFGASRSGKTNSGPFAVGAWLIAMAAMMPGPVYANPAIAIGANLVWPAAGSLSHALTHVVAESAGMLTTYFLLAIAYPKATAPSPGTPRRADS